MSIKHKVHISFLCIWLVENQTLEHTVLKVLGAFHCSACCHHSPSFFENLYFISFSHLCLIFLCLHPTNFCSNLSCRMLLCIVSHLSFATCFFHLPSLSLYFPFFSSCAGVPPSLIIVSLHLTSSPCRRIRRLVISSFSQFFFFYFFFFQAVLERAFDMDCFALAGLNNEIRAADQFSNTKDTLLSPPKSHQTEYVELKCSTHTQGVPINYLKNGLFPPPSSQLSTPCY